MLDDISLNLLNKTKLNDKQARVYLSVLQLGKGTVSEIAEVAGLKRPNTYVILNELMEEGYVNHVPGFKKLTFTATDPNALATELERTSHEFKEMLPYLRSMQRKAGKPHVTYYNGLEGVRRAFSQIRRPNVARYAISIKKAEQHVPDEVGRWKKTYLEGKARPGGKHLLTNSTEDRLYGKAISMGDQLVRYLSADKELDMDFALIDDTVYLTAFEPNDIHVTVIESAALANSLGAIFDMAWDAAKK